MAPWFDYSWILSVPKRCTHVTEGQLLTAGTQELLEASRALLYIVPNPRSGSDQARDSKGSTNTVLDSGCLFIPSIPLFLKIGIKRRPAYGFLFSWDLSKFSEQNRVNYVASSHFFELLNYTGFARFLQAKSWVELNASFIAQLLQLYTT